MLERGGEKTSNGVGMKNRTCSMQGLEAPREGAEMNWSGGVCEIVGKSLVRGLRRQWDVRFVAERNIVI